MGYVEEVQARARRYGPIGHVQMDDTAQARVMGRARYEMFDSWRCGARGGTAGRKAVAILPATEREGEMAVCRQHRDEWLNVGQRPMRYTPRRR